MRLLLLYNGYVIYNGYNNNSKDCLGQRPLLVSISCDIPKIVQSIFKGINCVCKIT